MCALRFHWGALEASSGEGEHSAGKGRVPGALAGTLRAVTPAHAAYLHQSCSGQDAATAQLSSRGFLIRMLQQGQPHRPAEAS